MAKPVGTAASPIHSKRPLTAQQGSACACFLPFFLMGGKVTSPMGVIVLGTPLLESAAEKLDEPEATMGDDWESGAV